MLTRTEQEGLDKKLIRALDERGENYIVEVERLLNEGANINNRVCYYGHPPLYHALQLGRSHLTKDWKKITELLLNRGADLEIRVTYIYDKESITLLHVAARIDANAERVTFLLDKGVNVNESDKTDGWTPLHHAAQQGNVEVIKALLARDATIDALDKYGSTPLHHAATERKTKAVELLLQAGAKANIQDRYGNTPLYNAVSSCRPGDSDLIYALVKAAPECVYLSGGVYSPGRIGKTPFEWASGAAGKCKLEYLKEAVAKLEKAENIKDNTGKTPPDPAQGNGHQKVVDLLKEPQRAAQQKRNISTVTGDDGASVKRVHTEEVTEIFQKLSLSKRKNTEEAPDMTPSKQARVKGPEVEKSFEQRHCK